MNSEIRTKEKPSLICFAGCDWWYHNKGIFAPQVMTRLARDYPVLFINSLGMRVPLLLDYKNSLRKIARKLRSMIRYLRKDKSGLYIFSPLSLPFKSRIGKLFNRAILLLQLRLVMKILKIRNPVYYLGCPPAWEVVKKQPRSLLVYEKTDIFDEMPGADKPYIGRLDDELTRAADLVLYVNTVLWQEGCKKNPDSLLIGHGVDFELFANAEQSKYIPEDIAHIPRPIVGFFGDISEDVCDLSLLEHLAGTLPEVSLVLVGPISSYINNLSNYDNVFFLGQKAYEQIPHYGKVFDVAIMPWKKNKWIEFCNPIKTKEYLALGKPIVSIDFPELKPFGDIVYAASNYDEFIDMIQKALAEDDPDLKRRRQERVKNETWDNKAKRIADFIEENLK